MSINKAYEQYKKVDLQTAPQTRLVVMMYEGAIKFLDNALLALDKKHGTEETHKNIVKAQEVICELLVSLNYDAGEIADRLAAIYTYMNQKLTEADISKNKQPIIEVLKYLKELKAAWDSAESNYSKQQSVANNTASTKTENKTVANNTNNKTTDNTSSNSNTTNTTVDSQVTNKKQASPLDSKLKKYGSGNKAIDSSSSGKLNISG